MESTSISLLRRLRQSDQQAAWHRFVDLYAPLIFHWGRNQGLNPTDTADLVQEVCVVLVAKLPEFEYDPSQSFRGWLRTITINKARDLHRRAAARLATGHGEAAERVSGEEEVDLFDEAEYRNYLVGRARELIEAQFSQTTWQACWKHVTEGRSASEVGRELGISPNAVRVAKCRILRRLREELEGLID